MDVPEFIGSSALTRATLIGRDASLILVASSSHAGANLLQKPHHGA
jgi:hypothetical protein